MLNHCLRCNQPCDDPSAFCNRCQSSLLHRSQQQYTTSHVPLFPPPIETTGMAVPSLPPAEVELHPADHPTRIIPPPPGRYYVSRRARIAFIVLTILALLALAVDTFLASAVFMRLNHTRASEETVTLFSSGIDTTSSGQLIPGQTPTSGTPLTQPTNRAGQNTGPVGSAPTSGTDLTPTPTLIATAVPTVTPPGDDPPGNNPSPPLLAISSHTLNYSMTQGQTNPADQSVTLINGGGGTLNWQSNVDISSSWLSSKPAKGALAANQAGQITVSINAVGLAPGTYKAQMTITATDQAGRSVQGSPQLFSVSLTVFARCAIQATPANLTFTSTLVQPNPPSQSVTLQFSGNCVYPTSWGVSVNTDSQKWLILPVSSGSGNGGQIILVVEVNAKGLLIGHFTGQITLLAHDASGATAEGSSQTISVSLTVLG